MESEEQPSDQQGGGTKQEKAKSVRLAVDKEHLDMDNPLHYLVALATEAKRYDGHWDGDADEAAKWTVAQWCQEIGFAPDLRDFDAGQEIPKDYRIAHCDWAFRDPDGINEDDDWPHFGTSPGLESDAQ